MMRQNPYVIVEIPKLRRQILVCDEVGEATFVVGTIFDRALLARMTKEDLLKNYPEVVKRVVYRDGVQWEAEVVEYLFVDLNLDEISKIDIRTLTGLRRAIKRQKPTAVLWVVMKQKEKLKFKVGEMGMNALARKFGVCGNPISNHSLHLLLGKEIYGENEVFEIGEVKEFTLEEMREDVKRQKPTAESWAGMKQKEKIKFKVGEMGMKALSTKFGVVGSPNRNHSVHLSLGKEIYGENEVFEIEEVKEFTLEELREDVKRQKPTAESWVGMKKKEKAQFKAGGMGLTALSTKFGVVGNSISNHSIHLLLGKKIYGEDEVFED
jgi:hypothetical protein